MSSPPVETMVAPPALTAERVQATVRHCLFRDEELVNGSAPADVVIAEGVVGKFGFHPGRLAESAPAIRRMLAELPKAFHADGGGGWSFLNACVRADGEQWGEHRDIDALLCLGLAIGAAKILLPRETWAALPGGMPYFSVAP